MDIGFCDVWRALPSAEKIHDYGAYFFGEVQQFHVSFVFIAWSNIDTKEVKGCTHWVLTLVPLLPRL